MATPSNFQRPASVVGVRQTEPTGYNPYAEGGLGNLPRRSTGESFNLATAKGTEHLARTNPLRLLKLLPDLHPSVGYALWNILRLACAPDDLQISAVVDSGDGEGEKVDEAGTKSLNDLWRSLPAQIGGLNGLQRQLTREIVLTGLILTEAVPGRRGQGVAQVCPVDSLTIAFKYDADGLLYARQRQVYPRGSAQRDGFVDLPSETCFWRALDPEIDYPYGHPMFGVAVNECVADIALLKDIRDAIHLAGSPRYIQGFAFQETMTYATRPREEGGLGMGHAEAGRFVEEQFVKAQRVAGMLRADDVWLYDSSGKVDVLDGAKGLAGLEKIVTVLRQRVSQALKSPGTMLGISDGSTDTFSTKELEIYAAGLESVRGLVVEVLLDVAALHLRLLGLTSKPKATVSPIRATDALMAAETEALEISNEERKVVNGWTDPADASKRITGSAPFDPERAARVGQTAPAGVPGAPGQTPSAPAVASFFKRGGRPAKRAA